MKSIVHVPNNVLNVPSETVTAFDKKLVDTIEEMKVMLLATKNPKGVGLAAPQVGLPLRLFLTKPTKDDAIRIFVNPIILDLSPELLDDGKKGKLEGCLSIPKIWGAVKRASRVKIRFQDEKGVAHEEEIDGFLATIVQHETDHVNGILFTQRVLEQKGKLYQTVIDREGKEFLDEMNI